MSENTTAVPTFALVFEGATIFEDFRALPERSLVALVSSGWSHKMTNEVASDVTSGIRRAIKAAGGDPKAEVTKDMIVAWRADPTNAEALAAFKAESVRETIEAIRLGTVGIRPTGTVRGPRLNELDLLIRDLAMEEVGAVLVTHEKLARNVAGEFVVPSTGKAPTSKGPLFKITAGEFSFPQMVDRRVAAHAERLRAEAGKQLARRKLLAEKAVAGTADDDGL